MKCLIWLTRGTEIRVTSTNCVSSNKSCNWGNTKIPLRDRRATKYPGENTPWVSNSSFTSQDMPSSSKSVSPVVNQRGTPSSPLKLRLGEALDPFDTMLIKMPFKSKELFHYCEYLETNNQYQQKALLLFIPCISDNTRLDYHSASSFGNIPGTQR